MTRGRGAVINRLNSSSMDCLPEIWGFPRYRGKKSCGRLVVSKLEFLLLQS